MERPYYMDYSSARLVIHKMVTSKYFDLAISAVIGLNVITMAMEFYMMPDVSSLNCRDKLRSPQIISHKGAWVCPQAVQLLLHWDLHNRGWNEGWRTGTWQIHVWQVKQMSQMIDHTYSSDGTSLTSQLFSSLSLGLHWKRSKVKYSPSIRPSSEWCEFFELPEFSNSSRWPRGSAHCWTLWCRPCLRWPPSSNLSFCSLPQVGNLGLLFFLLFFIFAALGVEMFGRLGGCRWCPDGRRGRLYICYSRVRPLRWF